VTPVFQVLKIMTQYQKIVVKVGSNVLTGADGSLNLKVIDHLVEQVGGLANQGIQIVLVSSGAVAAGRGKFALPAKTDQVSKRQLWSSMGQIALMNAYSDRFQPLGLHCSQVLVTREDFRDRTHYLNMKNCFQVMLQNQVIPIVNENDVISITELMFTDNDELAGLIASMVNSQALFILSNVEGIYDGDPGSGSVEVIKEVTAESADLSHLISSGKSNFGRGGMITKYHLARKVARSGIKVVIAKGTDDNIITRLASGEQLGTHFLPSRKASNLKKWLAHSHGFAKGNVMVNQGALDALKSREATSLLPIGVVQIEGDFKKGDLVNVVDEKRGMIGLGIAQYNSAKARERQGLKNQKALIHYDYLFLN